MLLEIILRDLSAFLFIHVCWKSQCRFREGPRTLRGAKCSKCYSKMNQKLSYKTVKKASTKKKNTPKIRQKASGRTAERPTRKNNNKSMILKGFSEKKLILRKNRKKCDFKGLFGQKNKNSMSRFCTLLALHFYWRFGG